MIEKKGDDLIVNDVEQKEHDNVTKLWRPKLITGGKGPPGHDWLSELNEGTVFLVKPQQSGGFALGQFHMMHKLDNAIHLMDNLMSETHIWVDPQAFSSQFKLVAILYEPEKDGSD